MNKKLFPFISRIVVGICLFIMITGCASGKTEVPKEEQFAALDSTDQEASDVGNSGVSEAIVPKEKADILEKHSELISYLEAEDYQSAENYVHELVLQQKREAAGDIEDYLVTVDLNSENFEDYFEFVTVPRYNAFGEADNTIGYGVKNKKFDEGLILYSHDNITVEYEFDSYVSEIDLGQALSFNRSSSYEIGEDPAISYGGRITDGKVTYIKQEFVEDYPIPELKKPSDFFAETTVVLKNGEKIIRYLYPDYPY